MRLTPFALVVLVGCGSSDSSNVKNQSSSSSWSGDIEIRLVDAPAVDVTEIVVTITGVQANGPGGWVTIASQTRTLDLLELQGGTFALLGVSKLPVGKITQLRLDVTDAGPNYVTTPDKVQHPLVVPSGDESGLKLNVEVDVGPCSTGSITLDFDGQNSIFTHPVGKGAGDRWMLRPVIRLVATELQGDCNDAGVIDGGMPMEGGMPIDGGMPMDGSTCMM